MIPHLPLEELHASAIAFALPLRRSFRGLTMREGMLIKGPNGWGEFAPFEDYSPAMAARWLASAVEAAYGEWPAAVRDSVPVNAIIPGVPADDAAALTRDAVQQYGCTTIKVKVGGSLAHDEARVASVRDALDALLGRGVGRIRIDANATWTVPDAHKALRRLSAYGLEYVEQPCETEAELRELRRLIEVPIAVDESIRRADDPSAVRVHEFADVAILKAAPLGGAAAVLRVAEVLGLPVVVSGSLDSATGLDSGIAAAAALPELSLACGLGTGALLAADVVSTPRVPVDGRLRVQRTPPELDALLEARDRLSQDRVESWYHRLSQAWHAWPSTMKG